MTTHFIPGLELCGLLYSEVIKPILDFNFPNMRYSAALIGVGSEVLGFDTEISRDHDWGPRVKLFLEESNFADEAKVIQASLQSQLPDEFRGYPVQWTHFQDRPFPVIDGGRFASAIREKISDPVVKRIADRWLIGSVDQFSDSTDFLNEAPSFRSLYE